MWLAGALTLALLLAVTPMGALAQGDGTYVVQAGDWLARIAAQKLGDWKLYPAIVLATQEQAAMDNSFASVTDSWLVEPGWKLSIPSAEDAQGGLTVAKIENAEYPSELTQSGTAKLVEGGEIAVRMVTHGPDDPMCCPTQKVLVRYALQGDQLVETAREEDSGKGEAGAEIVGVTWEWERFEGGDDSVIEVNDPTRYTLLLNADGTYALRADCNTGSGSYTLEGSSLTLGPGPMTMAACPEDSLDSEFLKNLEGVRTYVMNEGKLVLNLFADAGNMFFSSAGSAE